jgi:signal transduction histidine kinase
MTFPSGVVRGTGVLRPCKTIEGVDDCIVLVRPTTTVGRHPSTHLTLPRNTVSRNHACIVREGGRYFVEDLNSSNGTYINSQPVRRTELRNLDRVAFGDVEFTFYLDEETSTESLRRDDSGIHFDIGPDEGQTLVLHTQQVGDPERALEEISGIVPPAQAWTYLRAHHRLLETIRQRPGLDRLLKGFLDSLPDVVGNDRGIILMSGEDGGDFRPAAVSLRGLDTAQTEVRISHTIVERCVRERVGIISSDASSDKRFSQSESLTQMQVRSAMCVPLVVRERILGLCYLDSSSAAAVFSNADLAFVTNLASQLALALDNLRMTRERLQAEQLVIIGQTMSEISHSIKNILSVTASSVELMERSLKNGDPERIGRSWGLVRQGMDRINNLVADMLNYSRYQERKPIEVAVNDVVRQVAESLEPQMREAGMRLEVSLAEGIKGVWLERDGLSDAVMNLAVNARDALTSAVDPWIRIETDTVGRSVRIRVTDNGEGIPPDLRERVFLPFFTTKGSRGNGMGLAMVRKFVHEMGGEIECESVVGSGTTFTMRFPMPLTDEFSGHPASS